MKSIVSVFMIIFCAMFGVAQNHITHFCGQVHAHNRMCNHHEGARDEIAIAQQELELFTEEYIASRGGGDQVYIIPVVFHIIHQNGEENISDEQITDCVNILTRDFRKLNADTSAIVDEFIDIAADCDIEFRLAARDPEGNCHTGINRILSPLTYDGGDPDVKDLEYWPRNSYLNVWVCAAIGDGVAGFTYLPGDVAANWASGEDGIVMRSDYVGSIGTSSIGKSRTMTHEVGHWLNLYHPWGPTNSPGEASNCNTDDLVNDTPNTIGYTSCDLDGASCGSDLDNVQNYMDYSYCSRMFTWGQRQRMRAALLSSVAQRNQLWTQTNLEETGVIDPPLCEATFTSDRRTCCNGESIQFNDYSYHAVTSWEWDFGDGNSLSGTDPAVHKNPIHQYASPGIYNVTLTVSNGSSSQSTTENAAVFVLDSGSLSAPIQEGFEGAYPGTVWIGNNVDGDETWEITPSASFSGDKSLKLRNYSIDAGGQDELFTGTFDMSSADTIWLSYKWAYASRVDETDDRLRISVTGDCGNTWNLRKLYKGLTNLPTANATNSQFTPSSESQWDGETLVLTNSDWMTDRFRVKFDFTSFGGNNLYLDDINIFASFATGVKEVTPVFLYHVYPNPSAGEMRLDLVQLNTERISIQLYNATGQLCLQLYDGLMGAGNHTLVVPDQPSGLYNLVLQKGHHTAVKKVIFE
jgi:PKD repeat protein